jgi:hypothetical protein
MGRNFLLGLLPVLALVCAPSAAATQQGRILVAATILPHEAPEPGIHRNFLVRFRFLRS